MKGGEKMRFTQNPVTMENEMAILYELGVPRSDIEGLAYERQKQQIASRKWN